MLVNLNLNLLVWDLLFPVDEIRDTSRIINPSGICLIIYS